MFGRLASFLLLTVGVLSTNVTQVTPENFQELADNGPLFVKFYAPWCGHCKKMAPAWEAMATSPDKGDLTIAEVDLTVYTNVGSNFGVKGFPTLKLFKDGLIYDYSGNRSQEHLTEWYSSGLYLEANKTEVTPSTFSFTTTTSTTTTPVAVVKPIIQLSDENFEHLTQAGSGATTGAWIVKFYSDKCGHCKAMAPAWQELSNLVDPNESDLQVAQISNTDGETTFRRFEIRGYPTIILFKDGMQYTYEGTRTADKFLTWYTAADYVDAAKQNAVPRAPSGAFLMLVQDLQYLVSESAKTIIDLGVTHVYPDRTIVKGGCSALLVVIMIVLAKIFGSKGHEDENAGKNKKAKKTD